ncbi:hypothetical protein [Chlorogloea sp. CCALA 695]
MLAYIAEENGDINSAKKLFKKITYLRLFLLMPT